MRLVKKIVWPHLFFALSLRTSISMLASLACASSGHYLRFPHLPIFSSNHIRYSITRICFFPGTIYNDFQVDSRGGRARSPLLLETAARDSRRNPIISSRDRSQRPAQVLSTVSRYRRSIRITPCDSSRQLPHAPSTEQDRRHQKHQLADRCRHSARRSRHLDIYPRNLFQYRDIIVLARKVVQLSGR